MCNIIHLQHGVIAILVDDPAYSDYAIDDLAHTIDLYIQYGNHPIHPIRIQINAEEWHKNSSNQHYIHLLQEHECVYGATLYDTNKKLISSWE